MPLPLWRRKKSRKLENNMVNIMKEIKANVLGRYFLSSGIASISGVNVFN